MQKFCLILCFVSFSLFTFPQSSTADFNHEFGSYEVGFKTVFQYDNARTYNPDSLPGNHPRPIQTLIWYPAEKTVKASYMNYKEYVFLDANIENFEPLTETKKEAVLTNINRRPDVYTMEKIKASLSNKTHAIKDAKALEGSFPIIVYAPSWNASPWQNSDLCEYIASHGYIVVSSPSLGHNQRGITYDLEGLLAPAGDIEFLIEYMENYPNADFSNIGIIGYSWGGTANIIAAEKFDNVRAVISIDGAITSCYSDFKDKTPYINPKKFDIPFMTFVLKPDMEWLLKNKADTTFIFFEELDQSDAYLIRFNNLQHIDFSGASLKFTDYSGEEKQKAYADKLQGFSYMFEYTLNFLDAYIKGDTQKEVWLKDGKNLQGISEDIIKLTKKIPGEIAYSIPEKDLFPEGITYSKKMDAFYVGSIYKSKIVKIDAQSGGVSDFTPSTFTDYSVIGIHTDDARNLLWACVSKPNADPPESAIAKFDLNTGELIRLYQNGTETRYAYNDLIIDKKGNVYISNRPDHCIKIIDKRTDELSTFYCGDDIDLPNGVYKGMTFFPFLFQCVFRNQYFFQIFKFCIRMQFPQLSIGQYISMVFFNSNSCWAFK